MQKRIIFLLCISNVACAELAPVTGNGTPNLVTAPAKKAVSAASEYEMTKRLQQLQTEVQQLTGKVEEQTYQIEELKKRDKAMYTDFDDRLQTIENKSSPTAGAPAATVETGNDAAASAPPSTEPVAATISSPEATTPEQKPANTAIENQAATETTSKATNASNPPPAAAAPISDAEKQEYQKAYDALRSGQTDQAISQFNTYLVDHPSSSYASNVQYWLGEAYRVKSDNVSARTAFNTVVEKFPTSEKVPDALLKLGYIEKDEKNIPKAKEILMRVIKDYPNSKAAKLAQKKLPMFEKGEAASH